MGSGKEGKKKPLNPKEMMKMKMKMKKPSSLGPRVPNPESKFKKKNKWLNNVDKKKKKNDSSDKVGAKKPKPQPEPIPPSQQLNFFLDQFQSANNLQLSSLESDSLTGFPLSPFSLPLFLFFHFFPFFIYLSFQFKCMEIKIHAIAYSFEPLFGCQEV